MENKVKYTSPYAVRYLAGGTDCRKHSLESAVLRALQINGYVVDRDEKRVDLSPWEIEYDADSGKDYLVNILETIG